MRFFGPIRSFFDILIFVWLFFGLCPMICGGSFASLTGAEQARFVALFQSGWFLESMWTQILILHLPRTQNVLLQSRPSRPVMLVTPLETLLFTILTFTSLGGLIGLTGVYFIYLAVAVIKEKNILFSSRRIRPKKCEQVMQKIHRQQRESVFQCPGRYGEHDEVLCGTSHGYA